MRAKTIGGAIVITFVLAWIPAAHAGGGTWEFEGVGLNAEPVLVSGEQVRAYTNLWLDGVEKHGDKDIFWAGPDEGPFFGYVIPRKSDDWGPFPPPLPKTAMYVGDVEFNTTDDPNILRVTLNFVMPDLEPGSYGLIHCNDPCTRQIGDTMSTRITVVEDKGQALLTNRLNRSERSLINLRARSGNRIDRLETRVSQLLTHRDSMARELQAIATKAGAVPEAPSDSAPWVPLILGAAAALLIDRSVRSWIRHRPTVRDVGGMRV